MFAGTARTAPWEGPPVAAMRIDPHFSCIGYNVVGVSARSFKGDVVLRARGDIFCWRKRLLRLASLVKMVALDVILYS